MSFLKYSVSKMFYTVFISKFGSNSQSFFNSASACSHSIFANVRLSVIIVELHSYGCCSSCFE